MLEDRDYMRQPAYDDEPPFSRLLNPSHWSGTMMVLALNVLVFIVECALSSHPWSLIPDNVYFSNHLALSLDTEHLYGLAHGYVWQLITYQFMHAGLMHLVFNCWAIYVFGRILEPLLGARNFLFILLSSGVVGGLLQESVAYVWPQLFGGPVVGASAGAFGLVAAFATLFPERELTMLLFLFIPVHMRAKTLLLLSVGLAVVGIIFSESVFGGHVANAAHLGGMFAGLVYVRKIILGDWFRGGGIRLPARPRDPEVPPAPAPAPAFWRPKAVKSEAELSAEELLKTQVDPILDKISAQGLQSLTAREREILEKASGKLAKK